MTDDPTAHDRTEAEPSTEQPALESPSLVNPWVPADQLEAVTKRIETRRHLARLALKWAFVIVGAGYLWYFAPSLIPTDPSAEILAREAEWVGESVLANFSRPTVPFEFKSSRINLAAESSQDDRVYEVTVRLRLAQSLYVPAFAAGTRENEAVRSVFLAARAEVLASITETQRERDEARLKLPTLMKRSQFAGKEMKVTVDLVARRDRFTWELLRPPLDAYRASFVPVGEVLPDAGVLVYDEMVSGPSRVKLHEQAKAFFERQLAVSSAEQP